MYLNGIPSFIPIRLSAQCFLFSISSSASYSDLLFTWLFFTSFLDSISFFCSSFHLFIFSSEVLSKTSFSNASLISSSSAASIAFCEFSLSISKSIIFFSKSVALDGNAVFLASSLVFVVAIFSFSSLMLFSLNFIEFSSPYTANIFCLVTLLVSISSSSFFILSSKAFICVSNASSLLFVSWYLYSLSASLISSQFLAFFSSKRGSISLKYTIHIFLVTFEYTFIGVDGSLFPTFSFPSAASFTLAQLFI